MFNIYHIVFIYSSVDGHLGCFHILAIVNNPAVNITVHVSFKISVFIFFNYISGSEIVRSHSSSVFSFFEEPQYCFPQWLNQFTYPPSVDKASIFSAFCQHLLFFVFLMIALLTGVRWYFFDFYLSVMITSLHVPLCQLSVFFRKISIQVFCPFLNWILGFFDI